MAKAMVQGGQGFGCCDPVRQNPPQKTNTKTHGCGEVCLKSRKSRPVVGCLGQDQGNKLTPRQRETHSVGKTRNQVVEWAGSGDS
jgi:hypothetical protein